MKNKMPSKKKTPLGYVRTKLFAIDKWVARKLCITDMSSVMRGTQVRSQPEEAGIFCEPLCDGLTMAAEFCDLGQTTPSSTRKAAAQARLRGH